MSLQSDYHFEYTECDVLQSRWRVAIPNKENTCTGLPDPVKGTQCSEYPTFKLTVSYSSMFSCSLGFYYLMLCLVAFSCSEGEFLDMQSQKCQKCAAGTYSLGTGVAFDEWDSLPTGFVTHGVTMNMKNANTECSKLVYTCYICCELFFMSWSSSGNFCSSCSSSSTWTPQGDFVVSNTDECTATLSYAVNLKKPGTMSFEYFYPDSSVYFEFFVSILKWLLLTKTVVSAGIFGYFSLFLLL